MMRADGIVTDLNDAALERLPLDPGDRVQRISYALERDEASLDIALHFVIDPVRRAKAEGLMARAYDLTGAKAHVLMAFLAGHSLQDHTLEPRNGHHVCGRRNRE